ncbi:hypothetical protein [Dyella sp. A6]|uniref:hypothetical protein n=1 Tax=Dyella aluminiiresistens TaxID=3069105 RepID=UPI002E76422B|nr:hypothetical protein [Dyella sp. A6]
MMIIGSRLDVRDSSAAGEMDGMDGMDDFPVVITDTVTPWTMSLRPSLSTAWSNVVN